MRNPFAPVSRSNGQSFFTVGGACGIKNVVAALEGPQMTAHGLTRPGRTALLECLDDFAVLLICHFRAGGQQQAFRNQFLKRLANVPEQFRQHLVLAAQGNRQVKVQVQLPESVPALSTCCCCW